jgi:hypothetical protein
MIDALQLIEDKAKVVDVSWISKFDRWVSNGGRKNSLVYGVGINDANYSVVVSETIDGKYVAVWKCPFYASWARMLQRCYSEAWHKTKPSYKGCTVSEEWKLFSNFRGWMEKQDWEGKHLDKDLLSVGTKQYSSDTCAFVSQRVNNFTLESGVSSSGTMIGVSKNKRTGKYLSCVSNPFTGKGEMLGKFDTELEAHLAWKARKHELACQLAELETDPRIVKVLQTRYL